MRVLGVWPAEDGWEVRSDQLENAQVFRSGAKAELAAMRLAKAVAHAGEDVSLEVFLRDGSLARTRIVWALDSVTGDVDQDERVARPANPAT